METKEFTPPLVAICLPYYDRCTVHWAMAFATTKVSFPARLTIKAMRSVRIDFARNLLAEQALEKGADYIFFQDSDTILPPEGLDALLSAAVLGKMDVVSGVVTNKHPPIHPVIVQGDKFIESLPDKETVPFFEADAVGMACCLISAKALKAIPKPWFTFSENYPYDTWGGEDFGFCKKARDAGFKVMVANQVRCEHEGVHQYGVKDMEVDKQSIGLRGWQKT